MSPNHETDVIPGPPNFDKSSDETQEKSRDDKGENEFKVTEPIVFFINEQSLVKKALSEISVGEGMVIKAILDTWSGKEVYTIN
jgi:hypothetical protein